MLEKFYRKIACLNPNRSLLSFVVKSLTAEHLQASTFREWLCKLRILAYYKKV